MCGIVGYVGKKQAAPILLNGLKKLEYRGYDSAGVAVRDRDGKVVVVKTRGKLMNLREKINDGLSLNGCCGIGHTRWATHGEPSVVNAHPHVSDDDCVVGVHNGIIENFRELKEKLLHKGYTFYSQTDTEVLVKLIDYYYKKYKIRKYVSARIPSPTRRITEYRSGKIPARMDSVQERIQYGE